MKLVFSPRALLDLEEIGDYIARDSPKRALSFLSELQTQCERIAEMPSAFPLREDISPGLQTGVHGNYLILFHVENNTVRVERIVHGARRLQDLV